MALVLLLVFTGGAAASGNGGIVVQKTGAYAATSLVESGSWNTSTNVFTPDGKINCGATCSVTGSVSTNLWVQADPYALLPQTTCTPQGQIVVVTCPASGPSSGTPTTYTFNINQSDGQTPATCDGGGTSGSGYQLTYLQGGDESVEWPQWVNNQRLAYLSGSQTDATDKTFNLIKLIDSDGSCGLGSPPEYYRYWLNGPQGTRNHAPGVQAIAMPSGSSTNDVNSFRVSPDGTKIAYEGTSTVASGTVLHIANIDGSNDQTIAVADANNYLSLSSGNGNGVGIIGWSPDGSYVEIEGAVVTGGVTGVISPISVPASGATLGNLINYAQAASSYYNGAPPAGGCLAWYSDTAVYASNGSQLYVLNSDGSESPLSGNAPPYCPDAVSASGNIAGETLNGTAAYIADHNNNLIAEWAGGSVGSLSLSPDGQHLAWNVTSGGATNIVVNGVQQTFCDSSCSMFFQSWAPDSQRMADIYDLTGSEAVVTQLAVTPPLPDGQTYGSDWGNNPSGGASDPVNTATGAFTTREKDMSMAGIGIPLQVTRYYNSRNTTVGDFGQGWSWSFGAHLNVQQNGDVLAFSTEGQQVYFTHQQDGSYTALGATATVAFVSGTYTVKDQHGDTFTFDSNGKLLSISDRNLNTISFHYDGNGVLQTITDTAGRTITVSHNAQGLISEIALPDGRHVDYGYTNGLLTSVTDLRGKVWNYAYDAGGRMASIQDPLNHYEVRNTYDSGTGRITQQLDADGNPTTFSWDAAKQQATTTDPNGQVWTDYYDGNKLLARKDPLGHLRSYVYGDGNFNRTAIRTPNGNVTKMTYDSRGNMLTRTAPSPFNYTESWTYNANNDVLSYVDRRNNETDFQYDGNGNLIKKTSPGNIVTQYGRASNGTGEIVSVTTPRLKVWHYGYDSQGNRTSMTDPDGNQTTYGYDSTGRLTSITTPRGNVPGCNCAATYTSYLTYTNADHLHTVTDPLGHETIYSYDDNGKLSSRENAKLQTTSYGYNADNELNSISYPDGSSVSYGYDSRGNKTSFTDQLGHQTTYGYDNANRRTSKVSPLGNVPGCGCASQYTTNYGYDKDGNLTSVTDPLGHKTTYTYDALDRRASMTTPRGNVNGCGCASSYTWTYGYGPNSHLTSVQDPTTGAGLVSYGYDALGHLTTYTDGRGKTWTYGYDANGNLTSVQDQDGDLTTYSYDDADQKLSMVDPRGNVAGCNCAATYTWSYAYNPDGDLKSVTDPNQHTTQYGYDAAGRKTSMTDPLSHETDYGYDELNRLTSVTAPASGTTSYGYDNVGNLISRTDANQHLTQYNYDLAHRLTSVVKPSGTWSYSYDANNELTQKVDANGNATPNNPNDGITNYGYNTDGTLASVSYSDSTPTVSFLYDEDGNVKQVSDGQANPDVYTWSADNRMVTSSRGSAQFTYRYDAAGNVSERAYPDGVGDVTYSYDNEERMSAVNSFGGGSAGYAYDQAGNLTSISDGGNNNGEIRQYDPAGQLTEVKNATNFGSGTVFSKYDVTYDANGNPLQLTAQNNGTSWTENYSYDNANRVTGACYQASCASATDYAKWTYDNVGNRLTETDPNNTSIAYNYNSADELTSAVKTAPNNPYSGTVQTDGAQPYFRFGETMGGFNSSVGSFAGTWTGSPTLNVPGALNGDSNGAVKLNGSSQYGTVASSSTLNKTNNFSVELWLKRAGATGTLQAVAGKPLTTTTKSENYAIWLTTGNKVEFQVGSGTKSQLLDSSGTITDTTNWHYIVATFASGVMKLYVDNGTPTTVTASFTSAGTNSSTLDVGRAGTANYFNGSLDEFAIYPSVLSSTQVNTHYTQATTTPQTTQTTTNYNYDANGQQTAAGSNTFSFNVPGELTSATVGGTTSNYTYDGLGNRLAATSGASTTNYTWDVNNPMAQLIEETNGSSGLLRRYVNGVDGVGPVSMTTPTSTYYYSHDAYGSVADVMSSSGASEWAYQYGPFGTARAVNQIDPTAPANPVQFDAQYADGSGLYNLRAREFDSATGRFLSTDPVAAQLKDPYVSSYVYASDAPTLYDDPTGRCTFCDWAISFALSAPANLGNLAIGVAQGAANLVAGTADFALHYPSYFNAIRTGVAQGGWGYLANMALAPIEECANGFYNQDYRAAGRGCLKSFAMAVGVAEAADLAGSVAESVTAAAAAALRDETGSIGGWGAADVASRVPWVVGKLPGDEEGAALRTLGHIDAGTKPTGALAKKWGSQFKNWAGDLPGTKGAESPYREYRVAPPPGASGAGTLRLVVDSETGAVYYSWTHYGGTGPPAFVRIR